MNATARCHKFSADPGPPGAVPFAVPDVWALAFPKPPKPAQSATTATINRSPAVFMLGVYCPQTLLDMMAGCPPFFSLPSAPITNLGGWIQGTSATFPE